MNYHYFVSHGLGWATAPTLEEAIKKAFCTSYYGDMRKWLSNIHKDGGFGIGAYACRVLAPEDASYKIEWFAPRGVETDEQMNIYVTYVTQKKVAWCRNPDDKIRDLEREIDRLRDEKE